MPLTAITFLVIHAFVMPPDINIRVDLLILAPLIGLAIALYCVRVVMTYRYREA